jgi:carnitine 3-dehydrogenase
LLHVDMKVGKTCAAPAAILDRLLPIAAAHNALPRPEAAGRAVGQRK